MTVYAIFLRESPIHTPSEMEAYRSAPRGDLFGMKPLAVYGEQEVMEGEGPDGVIILEFPSMEAAKSWYNSPEYQAAAKHRKNAADYRAIFVEGFTPPGA